MHGASGEGAVAGDGVGRMTPSLRPWVNLHDAPLRQALGAFGRGSLRRASVTWSDCASRKTVYAQPSTKPAV